MYTIKTKTFMQKYLISLTFHIIYINYTALKGSYVIMVCYSGLSCYKGHIGRKVEGSVSGCRD